MVQKNLPIKILDIFENIEKTSLNNKKLNLNIAFNYGFKEEIKNLVENIIDNKIQINTNDEKEIRNLFYIGSIPDPDILIRTGGYKRLSNFVMYNLTYTELFLLKHYGPTFQKKSLMK